MKYGCVVSEKLTFSKLPRMKLKELESYLQQVEVFDQPKVELEQYPTTPHIASHMLYTIDQSFDEIEGKFIGDLGCGCGVLSIGCSILGCAACVGFDIDKDALGKASENLREFDIDNVDLVQYDLSQSLTGWKEKTFDTIIMNPPFGTKCNNGIDLLFVQTALSMCSTSVYSLHKTATRKHIVKKASEWGVKVEVLAELRFNLAKTYKFHNKKSVDIAVDFIRFSFQDD